MVNAAKKRKKNKHDISQIKEWEILQKDDATEWQMSMPLCEQKRSRGWFNWFFGTKSEIKESKSRAGIELNVSDQEN